ncbi:hypothetical protein FSP39_006713 [Pinctada imbricata]|uniref:BHLH domain-containing protein n=1 Tax=Pinctada imbricata TaxID=66713 RepID=A0AA88XTV7_PINIB|nr:hypothetical protein FSP39_006713 [Pinctada imbricata]
MMAIEREQSDNPHSSGDIEGKDDKYIHSGHFMISRVHDKNLVDDDDGSDDDDVNPSDFDVQGYNFEDANKQTTDSYQFGSRSSHTLAIDASLTKLFQCMTLAYSGKITSPRWKAFRGLHLAMKDKVRLNNIIWREWCMQYIHSRKPIICQFASPLSDDIHTKPEAIVLEGKYWKRRLDTVTAEYKKWRKFFKSRLSRRFSMDENHSNAELLSRVGDITDIPSIPQQMSATDLLINSNTDLMDIDFSSDMLFSSLNNQAFTFPNPRELTGVGVADLMQPGLLPLQPNLDDFMDTYDPIQEMFGLRSQNGNSILQFSGSQENESPISGQSSLTLESNMQVANDANIQSSQSVPINLDVMSTPGNNNANILGTLLSGLLNNAIVQQPADQNLQQQLLMQLQPATQQQSLPVMFELPNNQSVDLSNKNSPSVLGAQSTGTINNQCPAPGSNSSSAIGKSKSAPVIAAQLNSRESPAKKDVFAIPKRPVNTRKPRTIAPATTLSNTGTSTPTPSQQSTYLAQLLTKGTYKGAVITVKKEAPAAGDRGIATSPSSSLPVIQPASSSTSSVVPMLSEFPASVLVQAASQALGTNTTQTKDALGIISSAQVTNILSTGSSQATSRISAPESPQDNPFTSPLMSPQESPLAYTLLDTSPKSSFSADSPGKSELGEGKAEQRQKSHISAEQKRRCNIKSGFDLLHTLIPSLNQNPNAKVSKAAMLQKTAEYCKKLKAERTQMQSEAEILKQEIDSLNTQISQCQLQLPATGAPVTRQRVDQMKEMFQEYVKRRTLNNWKFWIFSTIIRGLFDSFNNMVSTASMDELCRTTLAWLDQHCSLVALRPAVLNALRNLSTTTSILSDPSKMPQQAAEAVIKGNNKDLPS